MLTCLMQQIASPLKDGSKPLTYPFYPMERFTKVASYESSWQIKIGIGTICRIRHGNLQIMQWCQYATKTHVFTGFMLLSKNYQYLHKKTFYETKFCILQTLFGLIDYPFCVVKGFQGSNFAHISLQMDLYYKYVPFIIKKNAKLKIYLLQPFKVQLYNFYKQKSSFDFFLGGCVGSSSLLFHISHNINDKSAPQRGAHKFERRKNIYL